MKKNKRYIGTVALIMAAVLLNGCGKEETQPETTAETVETSVGQEAELTGEDVMSFRAMTLANETVDETMFAEYELTMINIWATYCSPCISELPNLGALAEEYADKGFQVVGIVSDVQEGDDTATADDIVESTGANYKHLLLNQDIYNMYLEGVGAVPTTIFVDSKGNQVGEAYVGARSKEEWVSIIEELLS